MKFNDLKSFASKNGINTNRMNKMQIEAALAEANLVYESKVERRGRPINPNSARQARLARKGTVKRGRPVDATSARQARLARKGTVKRGRPINPTSARQIALAAAVEAFGPLESTSISENQSN